MMDNQVLLVPLRQKTVARLMVCRLNEAETLDGVVTRLAGSHRREPAAQTAVPATRTKSSRYRVTLLGDPVAADSLRGILSKVLNQLADLDGDFLHRLSSCQSRSRRHVAQRRDIIHPGRDDLNLSWSWKIGQGDKVYSAG